MTITPNHLFVSLRVLIAVLMTALAATQLVFAQEQEGVAEQQNDILQQECNAPARTPIVPDGNVASRDELLAAQNNIKQFQIRNLEFLDCAHLKMDALKKDTDANAKQIEELQALIDKALSLEEAVANEFNTARKNFMER